MVTEQYAAQFGREEDLSATPVFGAAFYDPLAGNAAAVPADGEDKATTNAAEVRSAQGAQLTPATASSHGQQIEHTEVPWLHG